MRESRRLRRGFAGVAGLALGLAVAVPVGGAPSDWNQSRFSPPFDDGTNVMTSSSFSMAGTFVRVNATPRVGRVNIRPNGQFQRITADGEPVTSDEPLEECPDSGTLAVTPSSTGENAGVADDNGRAQRGFNISEDASTWPCNGRYRIIATADLADPRGNEAYSMAVTALVAVRPVPVDVIEATVGEDDDDTVTVTWEKLTEREEAPDALGYRVQRAGPEDDEGDFGPWEQVGEDVPPDGAASITDVLEADGTYRYRVLSMREGANGPIFASSEDTAVAEATIDTSRPPSSTTTTEPGSSTTTQPVVPRQGTGRSIPTIPQSSGRALPAPPTTVDPGFDPELTYDGERRVPDSSPELAGESGQSIIRTDGEGGVGFAGPIAGGLVLLGWAGHVVYLNRLAKQF